MGSIPTLHRGQRFQMGGKRWRGLFVSECRAHCEAVIREPVTLHDRNGRQRTFTAERRITIDIAPTSGVDLLAELERAR